MSEANMDSLRALAVRMKELQANKESLEENVSAVNTELDDIRLRKIPEMMESLGLVNVTFDGVGRVQLASDLYCSTKAGQKDAAMQWLRDVGMEGMISETYNASSMKAYVRNLIKQGVELPDCLNVVPFTRASVVKA